MSRSFRIFDKQTKSYEWDEDREYVLSPCGELMELCSNHDGTWEYRFAETDRFIIEFDTGFEDKNGKEIYEGDIVNIKDDESVVAENNFYGDNATVRRSILKAGAFVVKNWFGDRVIKWDIPLWRIEVVGNTNASRESLGGEDE